MYIYIYTYIYTGDRWTDRYIDICEIHLLSPRSFTSSRGGSPLTNVSIQVSCILMKNPLFSSPSDYGSHYLPIEKSPLNPGEVPLACAKETSSSDCDDSFVAPTRFRVQAVALAVVAGTCWGFGPLGKKAAWDLGSWRMG